jgi:hypothetical protein
MNISKQAIDDALRSLSSRERLAELLENSSYIKGYIALKDQFLRLDIDSFNGILFGAYAVYGWMPTILKKLPSEAQASELVKLVRLGYDLEETLDLRPWKNTIRSINNSVSGTSKFLHFAVPNVFPIWDSVVARSLNVSLWQHARSDNYVTYFEAVHAWRLDTQSVLPENYVLALNNLKEAQGLSKIREIEFALFCEGQIRAARV